MANDPVTVTDTVIDTDTPMPGGIDADGGIDQQTGPDGVGYVNTMMDDYAMPTTFDAAPVLASSSESAQQVSGACGFRNGFTRGSGRNIRGNNSRPLLRPVCYH